MAIALAKERKKPGRKRKSGIEALSFLALAVAEWHFWGRGTRRGVHAAGAAVLMEGVMVV